MMRLVIHAGFHKTGTTSIQSTLRSNRHLLSRHLRVLLKKDFEPLTRAARAFSLDPDALTLAAVTREAEATFGALAPADPRPVLMSSEDLSGHLPGRHGLDRYDAASLVMTQLAEVAFARFGEDLDLVFYFSTRGQEAWLRSTWWQNLRSSRLTLDYESYARKIALAADLPAVLEEIAAAVAPARIVSGALEEAASLPLGPAGPLLELAGLPGRAMARMTQPPPANVRPDLGLEVVLLELNRSGLSQADLAEVKSHLLRLTNNRHR